MITLYQYYGCTLEVAFNHESFRYDHKQRPSSYPHGMLHTTLHDLLDRQVFSSTNMNSKTYYPLRERYLLGLNLARSLFYMFDGPWGSSNWKTDEIFFVFTHDSALEVDSHQIPYIRCSLDTTGVEEGGRRLYPTWLALAQILVEIHEGQSLQFAFEQPLGMAQLRQRILEHVDGKLEYRDGDAYYGEAIKACVNLGLELLPARRSRRKVARNLIRSKIIYNLEMNYKKWSSAPSENLDLNFTHTTSMIPFSTSNTSQISPTYATRKPITHSSSRLPPSVSILTLFDDNGSDDEGSVNLQLCFKNTS
ncbi:hypothetical protein GGR51DRAFT_30290 [Nemania sp. FL0031]|nr:hypothetical protein GGR51DRAFT_30290 [Nemania sp. FL0031]